MDRNRILLIGYNLPGFRSDNLLSNANLAEFSVVVWGVWQSVKDIAEQLGANVNEVLGETEAKILIKHVEGFSRKLLDWVAEGHNLIIIANPL